MKKEDKYNPFGKNPKDPFDGEGIEGICHSLYPLSDKFTEYLLDNPSIARKNGLDFD